MITGRTRILAHIGVPTESFKAPMVYNPYFEAHQIDVVTVPMGCEHADYPVFLRHLFRLRNIAGALVTMPHKVTTLGLVDAASVSAQICGACNAVRRDSAGRLVGDMFDGEGFLRGLLRKGRSATGARALIIGTGGVGSAIAASLAGGGAGHISLFDVNTSAAERLAARLATHYPDLSLATDGNDPAGHDIVVNATPLGMEPGDPLPLDVSRIDPAAFVGEVVMRQEETAFLAAARARGCETQVGTDMLFEQIPAYLDFFGLPTTSADELRALSRIRY